VITIKVGDIIKNKYFPKNEHYYSIGVVTHIDQNLIRCKSIQHTYGGLNSDKEFFIAPPNKFINDDPSRLTILS
jgi:hypothetical protein